MLLKGSLMIALRVCVLRSETVWSGYSPGQQGPEAGRQGGTVVRLGLLLL